MNTRLILLISTSLICAGVALPSTITGGTTTVALNGSFLSLVTGAGITPAAVAPATLSGTTATFSITGGDTSTGMIDHSGGLSFTDGTKSATIENFVIDLNSLLVTGEVIANGGTPSMDVKLFNIGLNDTLTLNYALGSDLTAVFGVPNFSGYLVGTATVSPVTSTATPEPADFGLFFLGCAALVAASRFRKPAQV